MHEREEARRLNDMGQVIALLLVALVFPIVGFVLLFVTWWWPPVVAGLAVLVWGIWLFVRVDTRARRAWIVAAGVVLASGGVFLGPGVADAWRHDQLLDRIEASACAQPIPDPGGSIESCRATGIANPSNGNSCGYTVTARIEAEGTSVVLGWAAQSQGLVHDLGLLYAEEPVVQYGDGVATVALTLVGDDGNDLRCM
jgi:hypothetical protein